MTEGSGGAAVTDATVAYKVWRAGQPETAQPVAEGTLYNRNNGTYGNDNAWNDVCSYDPGSNGNYCTKTSGSGEFEGAADVRITVTRGGCTFTTKMTNLGN